MIPLDDPRWQLLAHAYGPDGADVPQLIEQRDWYELWSTLCHQGTTYPASYAAIPHLVEIAASQPPARRADALGLIGGISVVQGEVPEELAEDYHAALARVPALAEETLRSSIDDQVARYIVATLAGAHGCRDAGFAFEAFAGGDAFLRCPNDACAVEMLVEGTRVVVDDDDAPVTPAEPREARWTDDGAALAAASLLDDIGRNRLAAELRALAGTARCPKCNGPIDVWSRLLAGDDT